MRGAANIGGSLGVIMKAYELYGHFQKAHHLTLYAKLFVIIY